MYSTSPTAPQAIIVTAERVGHDGRGMIFAGTATFGSMVVEATGHNPICDTLRAFLIANPEIDDLPWQLVRGDRIDAKGNSARKMAKLYVAEDGTGTRFRRRKEVEIGPKNRASRVPTMADSLTSAIPADAVLWLIGIYAAADLLPGGVA